MVLVGDLFVTAFGNITGAGKVTPEYPVIIEAEATVEVFLENGLSGIGGHGEFAIAGIPGRPFALSQVDHPDPLFGHSTVDRLLGGVADDKGNRVVNGFGGRIFKTDLEKRTRNAGVLVVERNERIESRHLNLTRKLGVAEVQSGNGELANEFNIAEIRETGNALVAGRIGIGTVMPFTADPVGRFHFPTEGACVQEFAIRNRFDCKMGEAVVLPLGGTVEDLPFDETPISSEADAAAADTSKWKRNLSCSGARV